MIVVDIIHHESESIFKAVLRTSAMEQEDADGDALAAAATATSAAETAAAASAAATAVPPAQSGVTSKGRVAIMTDGEEVGKKITTDAVKEAKEEEQEEDEEERIESREKGGENPSSGAQENES